jgi:mannosyltransferase
MNVSTLQRDDRLRRVREGWILLALILLAAALRLPTLGRQSYWYDEVVTVNLLDSGLRGLLHGIRASESAPPLYYVVAWFWARPFGTGEVGLRLLSAFLGIATVPVAYLCGRALVSARAGLSVAALAAVSPALIWYSQEARAYSLFVLLSALSFLFFVLARQQPSGRNLFLWSATSCLALMTHYFAVFLVLAEAAWLLAAMGFRKRLVMALAAVGATSAALLPLAVLQSRRGSGWIADIELQQRLGQALERLIVPSVSPWWAGVSGEQVPPHRWVLAAAVLVAASATLAALGTTHERRGGWVAFGVAAATVLVPLGLSLVGDRPDRLLDRNMLAAWVPVNLGVAAGFSVRRAGRLGVSALVALCVGSAALTIAIATQPSLQRDAWRSIAGEIQGSEGVVVVDPFYQALALQHYAQTLEALPPSGTAASTIRVVSPSNQLPELFRLPHGFAASDVTKVQRFTVFSFRSREPRVLTRRDLMKTAYEGVFTFLVQHPKRESRLDTSSAAHTVHERH